MQGVQGDFELVTCSGGLDAMANLLCVCWHARSAKRTQVRGY